MKPEVLQNRYKVLSVLGRGGMGVVYLCEDLRLPGKRWALKEMLCSDPALAAQARESFEQEAAMLSALPHRQLPELIDYFVDGDRQYLVMEYVEGPELLHLVQKDGPVSEADALRWGLEIALVLDYLHGQERPIIYRDLKPMNVIVCDSGRHVKLVDFGLARYYRPDKRRDTHASGSAGYAPPELWEDLHQTDARSDVYSLGATLYFALTGKHPSPNYGTNRIEQHRRDLSPQMIKIVNKCLEPEPRDRYANTGALIADMRALLEVLEPRATVLRRRERSSRQKQTPTWLLGMLAAATVVVLVGLFFLFAGSMHPETPPPELHDAYEKFLADAALRQAGQALYDQGQYQQVLATLQGEAARNPDEAALGILLENARAQASGKPVVRLPVLTSLTGSAGRDGYQILHGVLLAQKQYNQEHEDHKAVLDVYDDGSQVDRALEQAQQVAGKTDYAAGIGPFDSQRTLALAPFLNVAHLPMVSPLASDPRVATSGPYVFTVADAHTSRIDVLADHVLAKNLRKIAIMVDEESRLSSSLAQEFQARFEAGGGKVVLNQTFNLADPDFARPIRAIKSSGADCVFIADYRATLVAAFTRKLRLAGSTVLVTCFVAPHNPTLAGLWTPELDGLVMSAAFDPDSPLPEVTKFSAAFRKEFQAPGAPEFKPGHREAAAFDAFNVTIQSVERGKGDREHIRSDLSTLFFQGVTGSFSPGHQDHQRPVYLVELRNGRYVRLATSK